ncbi:hypothetical protein ELD05_01040 [Caldicellulosiruptor changbaiensis]|uniref:Uncharacterized protein n=1 Tax=Caldicellulosiruptor changbaiensis TaxID=1222016 RepID=A0A3T0D299_9FIRM|nr:hypothetical protein [Caldicellulosiruptor changbaiensis]AZT89382.1 hypothetical protein ELD05_01040 [Caldicellulosiruptor changbaiensis]
MFKDLSIVNSILNSIILIIVTIYTVSEKIIKSDFKEPQGSDVKSTILFYTLLMLFAPGYFFLHVYNIKIDKQIGYMLLLLVLLSGLGLLWNKQFKMFIFKDKTNYFSNMKNKPAFYMSVSIVVIIFVVSIWLSYYLFVLLSEIIMSNYFSGIKLYVALSLIIPTFLIECYALVYWIHIAMYYTLTTVRIQLTERMFGLKEIIGLLISQNKEFYIVKLARGTSKSSMKVIMIPKEAVKAIMIIEKPVIY